MLISPKENMTKNNLLVASFKQSHKASLIFYGNNIWVIFYGACIFT